MANICIIKEDILEWYLYWIVTRKTLRTCEEKQLYILINVKFTSNLDPNQSRGSVFGKGPDPDPFFFLKRSDTNLGKRSNVLVESGLS